ncbi:hypothetical protein Nos7524_0624 [Nostoc sp. PCC 7524]|jgi:hypothetical protein|uniref:hypothetical protein n=1 Tax=Nostoc sp. (strain ATCC 29411 / PCC 7524) TaxID=28072 RepID=UPI00029F2C71|nr:hypothetical protein [Nostoc sp. PCC 7524]AFY46534.1 hypothetical protein Nos7524_0624 [Nostoc sp. PCC 7524]
MSTLVVNFLKTFFIKFKNLKPVNFEKPGQPVPGFSVGYGVLLPLLKIAKSA